MRSMCKGYVFVSVCVCVCAYMCVVKKHGCLLSYRSIIATNSPISLGLVISVLGKMPTKSGESSVECYGHAFLIALLSIRTLR